MVNKIVAQLRLRRRELREAASVLPATSSLARAAKEEIDAIDMELAELEREEQARPDPDGEFADAGFREHC